MEQVIKSVNKIKQLNVLGVIFDATMKWTYQVESTLKKANSAKFAIKMISKFFNKKELNDIITACFYSVLYYNADIWLMPTLSPLLKQKLLTPSSQVLRIPTKNFDRMTSFKKLHTIANRATPEQICQYKHALLLHKIYNDIDQGADWLALNFNQNFNERNQKFITIDSSKFKIGKNIASNRLRSINNKIELKDLNDKMPSFKIKMKKLFLC